MFITHELRVVKNQWFLFVSLLYTIIFALNEWVGQHTWAVTLQPPWIQCRAHCSPRVGPVYIAPPPSPFPWINYHPLNMWLAAKQWFLLPTLPPSLCQDCVNSPLPPTPSSHHYTDRAACGQRGGSWGGVRLPAARCLRPTWVAPRPRRPPSTWARTTTPPPSPLIWMWFLVCCILMCTVTIN